jgi:2,3-bisphosphoglycerate-independent phosphoglycerate mutase
VEVKNSLPEILSTRQLTQLRIAETEKYAHVTFFFSCGVEKELPGETRILVKSPAVATYDLKPEMSSAEIGEKLREAISSEKFDFIIVNYANPDMVGHSGMLDPSIRACEAIDSQLGLLEKAILEKDGIMLISADHGNIECMLDSNHHPHTSHTTNPVPFILIGKNVSGLKLENGGLKDIAPTVLHLMKIEKPQEMDGKNLIKIS